MNDNTVIIAALIGLVGTILAALISAYTTSRRSGPVATAVRAVIDKSVEPIVGNKNDQKPRASSWKLILRIFLSLAFAGLTGAIGNEIDPEKNSPTAFILLGFILCFVFVALISVFRLIFRIVWAVFRG